jgi:hypothetical protein
VLELRGGFLESMLPLLDFGLEGLSALGQVLDRSQRASKAATALPRTSVCLPACSTPVVTDAIVRLRRSPLRRARTAVEAILGRLHALIERLSALVETVAQRAQVAEALVQLPRRCAGASPIDAMCSWMRLVCDCTVSSVGVRL